MAVKRAPHYPGQSEAVSRIRRDNYRAAEIVCTAASACYSSSVILSGGGADRRAEAVVVFVLGLGVAFSQGGAAGVA